ncbi:hypothetical protein ACFYXV_29180 [Streptomyces sp. NPDC002181]|uniref:hypothetical protein n=1 Tax=Streptomyces sp. NPDC002181 TaxID=3364635 RepID=UPI003684479C
MKADAERHAPGHTSIRDVSRKTVWSAPHGSGCHAPGSRLSGMPLCGAMRVKRGAIRGDEAGVVTVLLRLLEEGEHAKRGGAAARAPRGGVQQCRPEYLFGSAASDVPPLCQSSMLHQT